jgi:AcrR family transcriptional regulator
MALRADARRNRDRLLVAAAAVVAEQGADASLEEIARRAGVGSATLHRHFASRQALLEAVFAGHVGALCARADELVDAPRPDTALVDWLHAVLRHATEHRGLAAALRAGGPDPATGADFHRQIHAAAERLLLRAQQERQVRAGVLPGELLQLVNAVSLAAGVDAAAGERLLDLALTGVREPTGLRRAPTG